MPFVAVPNCIEAKLVWSDQNEGVSFSNVLHLAVAPGYVLDQSDTNQLASDISAALTTSTLDGDLSNNVTLVSVIATDIRTLGAPQFTGTINVTGTNATHGLPAELAICVTLRTDFRARTGRGRIYLSGFTEDANSATARVDAAVQTNAQTFVLDIITNLVGSPFVLGVRGLEPSPTVREVTRVEVRNRVWKAQRRRRPAA